MDKQYSHLQNEKIHKKIILTDDETIIYIIYAYYDLFGLSLQKCLNCHLHFVLSICEFQ